MDRNGQHKSNCAVKDTAYNNVFLALLSRAVNGLVGHESWFKWGNTSVYGSLGLGYMGYTLTHDSLTQN